jgi:hypothetical protein
MIGTRAKARPSKLNLALTLEPLDLVSPSQLA